MLVVVMALSLVGFAACNDKNNGNDVSKGTLRFAVPDGTPALATIKLFEDNKTLAGYDMDYNIVAPNMIMTEMTGEKADVLVMPTNAGVSRILANTANKSNFYRLAYVVVGGSLSVVGKGTGELTLDALIADLKAGAKMASIGLNNTPDKVFRYIVGDDYAAVSANIEWVANGVAATAALSRENNPVKYALVGEPDATNIIDKTQLGVGKRLSLQREYADAVYEKDGLTANNFPQACLFVKRELADDTEFMTALENALKANHNWVHATDTTAVNALLSKYGSASSFNDTSKSNSGIVVQNTKEPVLKVSINNYLALMGVTVTANDVGYIYAA